MTRSSRAYRKGGTTRLAVRCPSCGLSRDETGPGVFYSGPLEDIFTCPACEFMWGKGQDGRGIEYWSAVSAWTRAPEGCMLVLGVL